MEAGDDMDPPGHEVVISIDDLTSDLTSDSPGTSSLNPGDRLVSQSDAETAGRGALPAGKTATCSWLSLETAFTLTGEGSGLDEAALRRRVSVTCGVSESDLELYELRPIDSRGPDGDAGDIHIGVRVRSTCTPPATPPRGLAVVDVPTQLEGTPVASGEQQASPVRVLREHADLQRSIIKDQIEQLAQKTVEAKTWEQRTRAVEATNESLGNKLSSLRALIRRSEEQWEEGRSALSRLRQEFKSFSSSLGDQGQLAEQEDLLYKKLELVSPGPIGHMTEGTRRSLGSKNLKTLMRLLENPSAMDALEKMAEQTKT